MAKERKKIEIPLEKIEELLPEYRILSRDDLWAVYRALSVLWEKESKGLPEEFRQKLFAVEQHVYHHLVNKLDSPYGRNMADSLARLKELLPDEN